MSVPAESCKQHGQADHVCIFIKRFLVCLHELIQDLVPYIFIIHFSFIMEISAELDTSNRPDEWKIEQGMAGHKLPILDQTGSDTINLYPPPPTKLIKDEEAI
ncbi:Putative Catalytic activity: sulfite O2 H2O = sulfate H2O2 [Penicillium brasilianum]|uniref:Putative Catalytic activity: sulfite O2 H2O = sulfate H2O2 n=1 Tax=Penicillium brasilianum TaxID=104259 RepID=A0A0F7VK12_PENBI|nr:Putative Catalytic activity: sulfite O2 H2O = sulfate H2O2 [Penicillium brasilianum]